MGLVIDNGLYHGPLGYAILFPKKWDVDTKTTTVRAKNTTNQAMMQINYFTADPRMSPKDFLGNKLGIREMRNGESLTVNKMPAFTGITTVDTPYGRRLSRIALIYMGRRAYLMLGSTKDMRGLSRYDGREFTSFTRDDGLVSVGMMIIWSR